MKSTLKLTTIHINNNLCIVYSEDLPSDIGERSVEMRAKDWVKFGEVKILVNVPGLPFTTNSGFTLLTLTGTILTEFPRKHDCPPPVVFPDKIEVTGKVTEEEEYLIVRVSNAILPNGFPLTINDLTTDVAINTAYIVIILPVIVC